MPWSFSVGVAYVTRDALSQQISQLDAELYPTKRLLWGKIVMTGQVEIASSECKGAFYLQMLHTKGRCISKAGAVIFPLLPRTACASASLGGTQTC